MLVVLLVGVKRLGADVKKFAGGFTVVFVLSYACWILGSWAYIAATPDKRAAFKIAWSLNLTNESGFIIALLVGLFIGNFLPGRGGEDQGSDPPRAVHQDSHRDPGRIPGHRRPEPAATGNPDDVPRHLRHRRGLPDLLAAGLLHLAQILQVQPRVGSAVGLRHLHLRCFGGHRHRRRHPRPASGSHHGLLAGGDLLGGGTADPAVRGPALSLARSQWWPAPGWAWRSRPTVRLWPAVPLSIP